MKLHIFVFHPYQVNSYVVSDSTGECLIIDPACSSAQERNQLVRYVEEQHLRPMMIVNTHGHFDHVIGNAFVAGTYHIPTLIHADDATYMEHAWKQGELFGFTVDPPPAASSFLTDGGTVRFGHSELTVYHTPGHSPGGVVLYAPEDKFVIAGDTLFRGSIGRTDLPGGDYDQLMASLRDKVLVLPRDTRVFCGHGPATSIENEILNNPFL